MRTPISSEKDAFRLVVAAVLALVLAVLVGWLTEPVAGVAVFAFMLAVAAIAYVRAADPDRREPLRRAAHAPHRHGAGPGERHVLAIANEALSGEELRTRIVRQEGARVELDVLAPVLLSRVHLAVSDIDRERADARARLERSLRWAEEQGIPAHGEVGDPSATTAIEDELRDFGADEVIVVTRSREELTWQERAELESLREELDVPVLHIAGGVLVPPQGRSTEQEQHVRDRAPRRQNMSDQPTVDAVTPTHADAIAGFLRGAHVAFELVEHEPVMSAGAEAHAAHLPPEQVAKTIVLHDGNAYVIAAISAADRLDLHKLREQLDAGRRLRLASEEQIARDFPSLEVGAVPPFGPMVPAAEVIDRALAAQARILCPAGDHRHSVLLDPRDVVRLTAAEVADICEG